MVSIGNFKSVQSMFSALQVVLFGRLLWTWSTLAPMQDRTVMLWTCGLLFRVIIHIHLAFLVLPECYHFKPSWIYFRFTFVVFARCWTWCCWLCCSTWRLFPWKWVVFGFVPRSQDGSAPSGTPRHESKFVALRVWAAGIATCGTGSSCDTLSPHKRSYRSSHCKSTWQKRWKEWTAAAAWTCSMTINDLENLDILGLDICTAEMSKQNKQFCFICICFFGQMDLQIARNLLRHRVVVTFMTSKCTSKCRHFKSSRTALHGTWKARVETATDDRRHIDRPRWFDFIKQHYDSLPEC